MLFDPNASVVDIDFDDDDDIPEPNKELENDESNSDSESDPDYNEPLATFTRPRESQLSWRHKNEEVLFSVTIVKEEGKVFLMTPDHAPAGLIFLVLGLCQFDNVHSFRYLRGPL
jgi:hypothetical protein